MGKFGCVMVCQVTQNKVIMWNLYEMHSCVIVSSNVNEPVLVISKFLSVISVFIGPLGEIF
jgi:hypothetical protein